MLGPIMTDIGGTTLNAEDQELLVHPWVGGIILFARNFENKRQLELLISEIRALRSELLIAVDQEGGRVQRFQEGFSRLPALGLVGELYDRDPKEGLRLSQALGWLMASELRAMDLDLSFAPILDLGFKQSKVIGDRAFHTDPKIVTLLAEAYIKGMNKAGMAAVGKHFPGHGSVIPDSHYELPVDERIFSELDADLLPFEQLIKSGISGLMMAHILYPKIENTPVGFSKKWLGEILRKDLDFKGVIVSDDLSMQGAASLGTMPERAKLALDAGCDLILVCNNRPATIEVLKSLETNKVPQDFALKTLKGRKSFTWQELKEQDHYEHVCALCAEVVAC